MFGHPCAFVNGNMFLGTFAQSVIFRVGEAKAASLAAEGRAPLFEPAAGKTWKAYVHVAPGQVPDDVLRGWAMEAYLATAALPAKKK